MAVATPPPPPAGERPDVIAARMERMLNKKAEESYSPPGLFSQVRYLPDEPHADGEFVFEVSVNGEGYGGPMAVKKVVPQYDLTDPRWAASPFLFARMDVLSRVSRRMAEERKARDEEE